MADTSKIWRHRRAARLAAVQALYEHEVAGTPAEAVLANFLDDRWAAVAGTHRLEDLDAPFLRRLVLGVAEKGSELDADIQGALDKERDVARLEVLLRTILRAGTYELVAIPQIPTNVILNEYVEIAHAFFGGKEPAIVNAVLDRLAIRLRGARDPSDGAPVVASD